MVSKPVADADQRDDRVQADLGFRLHVEGSDRRLRSGIELRGGADLGWRPAGDDADLCDPRSAFAAFARSAAALDAWHAEGRPGPRPPGRLRIYQTPSLSQWTRTWATPLYRCFYDPDGRPSALRRTSAF